MFNTMVLWVAQGFGLGRIPWAPGTFGSVGGLVWMALLLAIGNFWGYLFAMVLSFFISVWFCGSAARTLGHEDPPSVVLDEIVAIPLCALGWLASAWFSHHHWPTPTDLLLRPGCWMALACFVLFRVFDIAKPWPVEQSQALPGGLGITVDDLLAATYVNLLLIPFLP